MYIRTYVRMCLPTCIGIVTNHTLSVSPLKLSQLISCSVVAWELYTFRVNIYPCFLLICPRNKRYMVGVTNTLRNNTLLIPPKYGLTTDKKIKLRVSIFPNYEAKYRPTTNRSSGVLATNSSRSTSYTTNSTVRISGRSADRISLISN